VGRWLGGHKATVAFGLVFSWIAVVGVLTFLEKPPGATSPDDLRVRVHAALAGYDAAAFGDLFLADTVGTAYATRYVARLEDLRPSGMRVDITGTSPDQLLVITAQTARGPVCTSWSLTERDGRWLLAGTPPLPAPRCPPLSRSGEPAR
jgi:hypothetical protein